MNTKSSNKHFVYILECSDKTYYVGYTANIKKRIETHNKGKASKYTRSRLPVKLLYLEECAGKSEGLKRELQIKNWNRSKKEKIVNGLM